MVEIITFGHQEHGAPWLDELREGNPDAKIRTVNYNGPMPLRQRWRNFDRIFRAELQARPPEGDVWLLEWDTLVRGATPALPHGTDVACVELHTWEERCNWTWWREWPRVLALTNSWRAYGLSPIAALYLSKDAVQELIGPRWDDLFNADIFAELRLGSWVGNVIETARVVDLPDQEDLQVPSTSNPEPDGERGMWHPVFPPGLDVSRDALWKTD